MNVLVLGGGGREAAIVHAARATRNREEVFCVPGNGAINTIMALGAGISLSDFAALRAFVAEKQIELTIVGPEAPLVAGIVDDFQSHGLRICGPTKAAARAEGSKAWFKGLLRDYDIPTAPFEIFNDRQAAFRYIQKQGVSNTVIKADGLMAGKGVTLPDTLEEAEADIARLMIPGSPGEIVVIEERLPGEEYSLIGATDGEEVCTLPLTRDYKRVGDGNTGKNTGGMGARTIDAPEGLASYCKALLMRVVYAMEKAGSPYAGFLYLGLMHGDDRMYGPKILEANCRLGDPEAQVILESIDYDFIDLCAAVADKELRRVPEIQKVREAMCVVLASKEYPDPSVTDVPISGVMQAVAKGVTVLPAGVAFRNGQYFTNKSGRVLNVVATGATIEEARTAAYRGVECMYAGDALRYRTDIGT